MQSKMYRYKYRKQNNAYFTEKHYQNPADYHQNINTECVIEKIARNIDLLMQRIFYVICIDTE